MIKKKKFSPEKTGKNFPNQTFKMPTQSFVPQKCKLLISFARENPSCKALVPLHTNNNHTHPTQTHNYS